MEREGPANLPPNLEWRGEIPGVLRILDQTLLPGRVAYRECRGPEEVSRAILDLAVRGAPAIGLSAAYGAVLIAQHLLKLEVEDFRSRLDRQLTALAAVRPTAVNLGWAVARARRTAGEYGGQGARATATALLRLARTLHREERDTCRALGDAGAELLPRRGAVLTHCNTGYLATGGLGTALAVVYRAHEQGKTIAVYADETRPLWQGLRLTAWELSRFGVPVTVLCDGAAGALLAAGRVDAVIVGADRITRRGDFANKIGTYPLAVLARRHGIPFYVAAPLSTFDPELDDGSAIPIEERDPAEVLSPRGLELAAPQARAWNPAFDLTPADLVTGIITEKGVLTPPLAEAIHSLLPAPPGEGERSMA